jgi:hypothetical protein
MPMMSGVHARHERAEVPEGLDAERVGAGLARHHQRAAAAPSESGELLPA